MSIQPNNSPRRDATKTDNTFNCNSDERVNNDGDNVVPTAQTSDPIEQHEEKITSLEQSKSLGVTLKEDFDEAHDTLSPSNNIIQVPDASTRKRKQVDTEDCKDDEVLVSKDVQSTQINIYDLENDNSCDNNIPRITGNMASKLSAHAEPIKDKQLGEQQVTRAAFVSAADILNNAEYPIAKKQKTELTEEKDTTKYTGDNCLENVNEMPCSDTSNHHKQSLSLEDEDISPIIARRPKVSLGSTVCDDDSYSESDDEMDIMIGESRWSKLKSSPQRDEGAASESIHHTESSTNHPEEDGDDSDIEYIGTSGSQPIDNVAPQIDEYCDENIYELDDGSVGNPGIGSLETKTQCQVNGGESSYSGGRETNICDGDLIDEYDGCNTASQEKDRDDLDVKPPPEPHNSPKKDVCFICGSDLSRLKFKGRVSLSSLSHDTYILSYWSNVLHSYLHRLLT